MYVSSCVRTCAKSTFVKYNLGTPTLHTPPAPVLQFGWTPKAPKYGVFVSSGSPSMAEALSVSGLDWVCIDMQVGLKARIVGRLGPHPHACGYGQTTERSDRPGLCPKLKARVLRGPVVFCCECIWVVCCSWVHGTQYAGQPRSFAALHRHAGRSEAICPGKVCVGEWTDLLLTSACS